MMIRIAPSMLSADFTRLAEELQQIEAAGAEILHLDVMDGHFVPNITIGPPVVKALRKVTSLTFDCHLMVSEPQRYIDAFLEAGAQMISVHVEADPHIHRALAAIRSGGAKAGIAINPGTAGELLHDALAYCDYILAMTVNPGFGGQKFIAGVVPKIRKIREIIDSQRLAVEIEVDGGIDPETAPAVVAAGATILVAGSAIFGKADRGEAIRALRTAATTSLV